MRQTLLTIGIVLLFAVGMLLGLFIGASCCFGASYYLDAVSGSDANPGTSTSAPWRTIAKVNATSLSAGDNVLFRCGQTFGASQNDTCLVVPSSGTSGNRITFAAWGSGSRPVITAGAPATLWGTGGWTAYGTRTWHHLIAKDDSAYAVWFGSNRGTRVMTQDALDANREWRLATAAGAGNDTLVVYLTAAADTANVERSKTWCLANNSKNYAVFSGLALTRGSGSTTATAAGNVKLTGDYATLQRCVSSECGIGYHVLVLGGSMAVNYTLIASDPAIGGIYNYGDGNTLLNNTLVNCAQSIAAETGTTGTVIRNNIIHTAATYFLYLIGTATYTGTNNLFFDASGYTNKWRKNATTCSALSGPSGWYKTSGQDSTLTSRVADPGFSPGTYRLTPASPGRNAGAALSLTLDLDLHRVPQESAPDVGCYEFTRPAPVYLFAR